MPGLFDIIGPSMVGPSSSHTAGACRLGYIVHALVGGTPDRVEVGLHGSFAMTGEGHGTKKAIVGGLLGFMPDDRRVRDSQERAREASLDVGFQNVDLGEDAHPNTARFRIWKDGTETTMVGSSIGGGQIRVTEIDGIRVNLSGTLPTLVVHAEDVPGTIAKIAGMFADRDLNLATMHVDRTGRGETALMTIEVDSPIPEELVGELEAQQWVHWIRSIRQLNL